MAIFAYVAISR